MISIIFIDCGFYKTLSDIIDDPDLVKPIKKHLHNRDKADIINGAVLFDDLNQYLKSKKQL